MGARGALRRRRDRRGPLRRAARSCFLDGLQVATGATMGKRNLRAVLSEQIVVRLHNTRTGHVAELRPTPELVRLLASFKPSPKADLAERPHTHDASDGQDRTLKAIARQIGAEAALEAALSGLMSVRAATAERRKYFRRHPPCGNRLRFSVP